MTNGTATQQPQALAKRFACISYTSYRCTSGNGAPTRKRCAHCGAALRVMRGTWGVFKWRADGRYPGEIAVKVFTRESAAERFTTKDTSYVVRWIPAP